ncbi:MAG: hypothetical protein M0R74_15985 [Dehalococcoidia bacterium]|nr:hypothetical protein [Dehalococcoidia bacterium]
MARLVLFGQGVYYLVAGVWPLLHMRSFTATTGPKVDLWLVKTVGTLIAVIGGVLTLSALRRRSPAEVPLLAAAAALALAAIEVIYVRRSRISPIYLLDAVVEGVLVLALLIGLTRRPEEDY